MARYIDADALIKVLYAKADMAMGTPKVVFLSIQNMINHLPPANVAPRAEVVNKICCEIEEEIVAALESNYQALKEWDDGRCNDYVLEIVNRIKGKIDALRGIEEFVEELKKKYTDATDTNVGNK